MDLLCGASRASWRRLCTVRVYIMPALVQVGGPNANNGSRAALPFLFVHQPKNAGTTVRSALLLALRQADGNMYPSSQLCVPN